MKEMLFDKMMRLVEIGTWEQTGETTFHPIGLGDGSWVNTRAYCGQTHEGIMSAMRTSAVTGKTLGAANAVIYFQSPQDAELFVKQLEDQRANLKK